MGILIAVAVIALILVAGMLMMFRKDETNGHSAGANAARKAGIDPAELEKKESAPKDISKAGQEWIKKLVNAQKALPGSDPMRPRLTKMQETLTAIYTRDEQLSSRDDNVRKMETYYLPTVDKLMTRYAGLLNEPDVENVTKSKEEIGGAMDQVNGAFDKVLNNMYSDDNLDISTDIAVMDKILERDALK